MELIIVVELIRLNELEDIEAVGKTVEMRSVLRSSQLASPKRD